MRKYFQVENVIPNKFFFTNRNPNSKRRTIPNMDDLFNETRKVFPERNFEMLPDYYNIKDGANAWCHAKLVFGPGGSNMYKHYFLKEKSVIIPIVGDYLDNAVGLSAATHDIYSLYVRNVGMKQFRNSQVPLDESIAIRALEIGLYCADHGHFNPSETFE